jgi:hypothetical protein
MRPLSYPLAVWSEMELCSSRCVSGSRRNLAAYAMTILYISDTGRDENDGLSSERAVRSWQRAVSLAKEDTEFCVMGVTALERVTKEVEAKSRREIYSKSDLG